MYFEDGTSSFTYEWDVVEEEEQSEGQPQHFGLGTWKGELPCTEMGMLGVGVDFGGKIQLGTCLRCGVSIQVEMPVGSWREESGTGQAAGAGDRTLGVLSLKWARSASWVWGGGEEDPRTEVGEKMRN